MPLMPEALIITTWPKSRSPLRQKLFDAYRPLDAVTLKRALAKGDKLLNLTGQDFGYPESLTLDPLEFAKASLTGEAEEAAFLLASHWLSDILQEGDLPGVETSRATALAKAMEAEFYRLLKDFYLAAIVVENAIETLRPERTSFLDSALAALFQGSARSEILTPLSQAPQALSEQAIESARLIRALSGYQIRAKERARLAGKKIIVFCDMPSHAAALLGVLEAMDKTSIGVLSTNKQCLKPFVEKGFETIRIETQAFPIRRASLSRTLFEISKRLKKPDFLLARFGNRLFQSGWVRRQALLLFALCANWERFWQGVFQRSDCKLALASVGIWPQYRTMFDAAKRAKKKTAILMHGNIPAYKPYYSYPNPDLYTVFGEVYRAHLVQCGLSAERVKVIGRTTPAPSVRQSMSNRSAIQPKARKSVLFLQSPPGSELNWLDYHAAHRLVINAAKARRDWRFVVKLHPNQAVTGQEFQDAIRREGIENLEIVKHASLQACFDEAWVALGIYSTTMLDALEAGLPLIELCPNRMRSLMPFAKLGLAMKAASEAELLEALLKAEAGDDPKPTREGLKCFRHDAGLAAIEQTVEEIRRLLKG